MKKFLLTCLMLPATMEPGDNSNQTVAMYKVFMNMYDTLIKIDYKNNTGIKPGLAESWKRIDDTTLELYLRKGVKFHDGSDFTADDVVIERIEIFDRDQAGTTLTGETHDNLVFLVFGREHIHLDAVLEGPDSALVRAFGGLLDG